ncbi:MAG: transglycosylase SLT domain-containing protein [Burkholderiaceae bacterium]
MRRSLMMIVPALISRLRPAVLGSVALSVLLGACASVGDSPTAVDPGIDGPVAAARSGSATAAKPVKSQASTGTTSARAPSGQTVSPTPPSTRTITVLPDPASPPVVVVAKPVEPAGPASLWDRIRAGFAMPELDTPLVADKERFYLQKPDYLGRMFDRGGRYLYYIVEELDKRGMPTELALLPFVESAMNPTALSSAQAAGLWQFIPSTGKQYNLSQNWWVDNRRDVVQSTRAALDYLQTIYAMHGNDWFLALASYNWGENAVARAVNKNRSRGRPTDYLSLDMPNETRHYVPKLIALKHIIQNADELGVPLPALANKPYFVTIEKTGPIDLKLAAQFAGMSVDEFVALNPAHNRPVIAATRNNEIKLPADRLDAFMEAVEKHGLSKRPFASWQPHTLAPGETLETVAQRAGITVAELRRANSLSTSTQPLAGTRIIAPRKAVEDETRIERFEGPRVYEEIRRPPVYHVVKRGETLYSIAARYGVSGGTVQSWNGLKAPKVARGMRLMVRPSSSQTLLTDERGTKQIVSTEIDQDVRPIRVSAPIDDSPAAPPATAGAKRASPAAARTAARPAARPAASRAAAPAARTPVATAGKAPAARTASARQRPASTPAAKSPARRMPRT